MLLDCYSPTPYHYATLKVDYLPMVRCFHHLPPKSNASSQLLAPFVKALTKLPILSAYLYLTVISISVACCEIRIYWAQKAVLTWTSLVWATVVLWHAASDVLDSKNGRQVTLPLATSCGFSVLPSGSAGTSLRWPASVLTASAGTLYWLALAHFYHWHTLLATVTNLGAELPRRSWFFSGIRRTAADFDPNGASPRPYTKIPTCACKSSFHDNCTFITLCCSEMPTDCYERSFYSLAVLTACTFYLYCSMQCVIVPLKQYDDDYDDHRLWSKTCI